MNKIHIRDLALRCIIGVFPEERTQRQDIVLNITLTCDFGASARTDRLEDTVDYRRLTKQIITTVEGSAFQLLEALAEQVAAICLETPRVQRATVCIDKPGALRFARSVAVEITRAAAE
jgi:dihydroneopterin aldolase/D-erythro-7,8-dihydroneopterin triphosphate epimerase